MPDLTLPIVIIVLVVYVAVLLLLNRFNLLAKANIELMFGFFLMWRTTRGRKFINWLSGPRGFWRFWGDLSIVVVILFSVATFILLCWEAVVIVNVPVEMAPGPEMLIGIPGLNPIIPVGYGILALAIAILWHEFSHGILTRVARIRIRALGIIAVIFPIGAFVEPDEQGLSAAPRMRRARVYAAGPMANLTLAFVCALIFSWGFMTTVEPVHDGMIVSGVTKGYPAEHAGIRPWMLITEIQTPNFTADSIVTNADFADVMSRTSPGEHIVIICYYKGDYRTFNVTLADKYKYYKELYPEPKYEKDLEEFKGKGFLGVRTMSIREDVIDIQAHPMKYADTPLAIFGYGLVYVSMPILKLSPMPTEISDLLVVNGPMGAMPPWLFWFFANLFYWLFWLNFMVGATNALPARPLDGGHIFKDFFKKFMSMVRPGMPEKRLDKVGDYVSWALALVNLVLILWLVAGPYVSAWVRGFAGG